MSSYIFRRIAQCLIVILGVTLLTFGLMYLTGDPVVLLYGEVIRAMPMEELEAFRHQLGFDRPWIIQYFDYMAGVLQGDFGTSYVFKRSCLTVLMEFWPNTIKLALCALTFTYVLALPLGIVCATKRGSLIDRVGMGFGLLGQSMPTFWLGLLFILIFCVWLRILPAGGTGTWRHFILPTVTMGIFSCARSARLIRSYMMETMHQDYIRTAEAKGLSRGKVVFKHTLRNVLIPLMTLIGMEFGGLLCGSVVTESVFSWPGVGKLMVSSIQTKDIPMVMACIIFLALVFVLINLVVDLLYGVVDPRARVKKAS